jgi:hypothetical protein
MKSEERHKLETNYLADHLGDGISKIKPYTNLIIGGIALLIIGGVVYAIFQNSNANKNAEAWHEMFLANGDSDMLTKVYEDYENTAAAPWARQRQADSQLARALDQVYVDKDQAMELTKQAKENYEAVLSASTDPMLRTRATLGLAKACETEGDADGAITHYRKLLTMDLENKALEKEVTRRIAWLDSEESKEFLAWYKSFQPTKAAPIGLPSNLNQVPSSPDMTLPEYKPTGIGQQPLSGPEAIATPPIINPPAEGSTDPNASGTAPTTPPIADPTAPTEPNASAETPATPAAPPTDGSGTTPNGGGQ